jgi:hypothetical protein
MHELAIPGIPVMDTQEQSTSATDRGQRPVTARNTAAPAGLSPDCRRAERTRRIRE